MRSYAKDRGSPGEKGGRTRINIDLDAETHAEINRIIGRRRPRGFFFERLIQMIISQMKEEGVDHVMGLVVSGRGKVVLKENKE